MAEGGREKAGTGPPPLANCPPPTRMPGGRKRRGDRGQIHKKLAQKKKKRLLLRAQECDMGPCGPGLFPVTQRRASFCNSNNVKGVGGTSVRLWGLDAKRVCYCFFRKTEAKKKKKEKTKGARQGSDFVQLFHVPNVAQRPEKIPDTPKPNFLVLPPFLPLLLRQ